MNFNSIFLTNTITVVWAKALLRYSKEKIEQTFFVKCLPETEWLINKYPILHLPLCSAH